MKCRAFSGACGFAAPYNNQENDRPGSRFWCDARTLFRPWCGADLRTTWARTAPEFCTEGPTPRKRARRYAVPRNLVRR
jgi:hypothetical protein